MPLRGFAARTLLQIHNIFVNYFYTFKQLFNYEDLLDSDILATLELLSQRMPLTLCHCPILPSLSLRTLLLYQIRCLDG